MDIVNWIIGSIHSTSFVVLINGYSSRFFKPSRGLIQGFPLSHFLFLLTTYALRKIIQQDKSTRSYKGVKISATEELSDIFFVVDAIMMGGGAWENVIESEQILCWIFCIFRSYSDCSCIVPPT